MLFQVLSTRSQRFGGFLRETDHQVTWIAQEFTDHVCFAVVVNAQNFSRSFRAYLARAALGFVHFFELGKVYPVVGKQPILPSASFALVVTLLTHPTTRSRIIRTRAWPV